MNVRIKRQEYVPLGNRLVPYNKAPKRPDTPEISCLKKGVFVDMDNYGYSYLKNKCDLGISTENAEKVKEMINRAPNISGVRFRISDGFILLVINKPDERDAKHPHTYQIDYYEDETDRCVFSVTCDLDTLPVEYYFKISQKFITEELSRNIRKIVAFLLDAMYYMGTVGYKQLMQEYPASYERNYYRISDSIDPVYANESPETNVEALRRFGFSVEIEDRKWLKEVCRKYMNRKTYEECKADNMKVSSIKVDNYLVTVNELKNGSYQLDMMDTLNDENIARVIVDLSYYPGKVGIVNVSENCNIENIDEKLKFLLMETKFYMSMMNVVDEPILDVAEEDFSWRTYTISKMYVFGRTLV